MDNFFTDLGVDPIEGAEIMKLAHINRDELLIAQNYNMAKDIFGYFQGKHDKNFMITKLLMGKQVNPIEHLWGYTQLRTEYDGLKDKLREYEPLVNKSKELEAQLSIYER